MKEKELGLENPIERIGTLAPELARRLELLDGEPEGDLSRSKWKALVALQDRGPLSVSALGMSIGLAQASTSELATRMWKAGLVKKTRNTEDGRVVSIAIAEQGRRLLNKRRQRMRDSYRVFFEEAGGEAVAAFLDAAETLLAILDGGLPKRSG